MKQTSIPTLFANKEELHIPTEIVAEDTNTVVHTLSYLFTKKLGSGSTNNDFELQITDPENPLLLFDYKLSPFDFPRLKEELVLYCEFSSFPSCIHDILTDCNEKNDFKAVIDCRSQSPLLLLQQMTKISLLTPIRLTLIPASDERIKEYLSNQTKNFKNAYEKTLEELQAVHEELQNSRAESEGQTNKFRNIIEEQKQKYKHQIEQLNQEHDLLVESIKNKDKEEIDNLRTVFEETKTNLLQEQKRNEEAFRNQISALQDEKHQAITQNERQSERILSLEAQNKEMKERLDNSENQNKKLSGEQQEVNTANSSLKTEIASLTAQHEALQKSFQEKSEYSNNLENTIKELRQTLQDKEKYISSINQEMKEVKKRADERDWIADKSKKVIAKHQEDIRKLIERYNSKKTYWEERDKQYHDLEKENIRLQELIKQGEQQLEVQNQKYSELESQNKELEKEIDNLKHKIAEDQVLTDYLQKSLNEKKLEEMGDDEYVEDENLLSENSMSLSNAFNGLNQYSPSKTNSPNRKGGVSYVPENYNFPQTSTLFESPNFY